MAVTSANFIADIIYFIKNDFSSNITDPLGSARKADSKFILSAYPQRQVDYPLITVRVINQTAKGAGMQTAAMDVDVFVEVRVWARNQKEKDNIGNAVYARLRNIQFTASSGSIANNIHDFALLSNVEINEDGEGTPKSRIMQVRYRFFDI